MSVTQASLQQTRELLRHERLNRAQVEALSHNGNLCGPLPDPSGYENDEPYWTKQAFIDYSETCKRSRANPIGMARRSMLATLLGRDQERKTKQATSLDDLAQDVAFERITIESAEAQCFELGVAPSDLAPLVSAITERIQLSKERERAVESRQTAERLAVKIAEIDAEIADFARPLRAKVQQLFEEMQVAEREAGGLSRIEQRLYQSAPQDLLDEISAARKQLNDSQGRPKWLRNQLQGLAFEIEAVKGEIEKVRHNHSALVVRKSDFEAARKKEALANKETQLKQQLKTLGSTERSVSRELNGGIKGESGPLREKLHRLGAMQLEVWPKLSDLDS